MKMKKINLLIVFLLSIATLIAQDINETKLIKIELHFIFGVY